jgi:hypothetical protein
MEAPSERATAKSTPHRCFSHEILLLAVVLERIALPAGKGDDLLRITPVPSKSGPFAQKELSS